MKDIRFSAYGNLCGIFYDLVKPYAPEKEVKFYASFMEKGKGRVLEAMCGSGRLQIPLLKRGFIVDGVDSSIVMLDRCRKRCEKLNLTPELYNQPLENLSLSHKYSTITIAVGSFQLITDRNTALRALKNLHAQMYKNGNLLIDIFVPDITISPRSVRIADIDDHSLIRLSTRYIFDEQAKLADAFGTYELITDGIIQQKENELIQVTWYTDEEFIQLLNNAGFDVVKIYEESFKPTGLSRIVHAQAK